MIVQWLSLYWFDPSITSQLSDSVCSASPVSPLVACGNGCCLCRSWGKIEKQGFANRQIVSFLCWKNIHQYHLCHHSSKIRCSFTRPTGAVSNKGTSGGSSWQRKIENKDKSVMKFAMISSWISHTQEKTHGIQTMFTHFGTETTCHLPALVAS